MSACVCVCVLVCVCRQVHWWQVARLLCVCVCRQVGTLNYMAPEAFIGNQARPSPRAASQRPSRLKARPAREPVPDERDKRPGLEPWPGLRSVAATTRGAGNRLARLRGSLKAD